MEVNWSEMKDDDTREQQLLTGIEALPEATRKAVLKRWSVAKPLMFEDLEHAWIEQGEKNTSDTHTEKSQEESVNSNESKLETVSVGTVKQNITVDSSQRTLKTFSGSKTPHAQEVNFRRWYRAARRVSEDKDLSEGQKKRIITKSLTGVADDTIELKRDCPVKEILLFLKAIFGQVDDTDDLLAEFHQRYQKDSETASEYLTALFVQISEIVGLEGISETLLPKELMKQFNRGVSTEDLLTKLRWEDKVKQIDGKLCVDEMFSDVRQEEARRMDREKRHPTPVVIPVQHQKQDSKLEKAEANIDKLQNRLDCLEASASTKLKESTFMNMSGKPTNSSETSTGNPDPALTQRILQLEQQMTRKGKQTRYPLFCYRCGKDNHLASECVETPNPVLVRQRVEERKLLSRSKRNQVN